MKKKIYSILCGALALAGTLHAETGALVMELPKTCLEYDILHVSGNGKWACGVINNGTFSGWVWNLTTGQLTELTQVGVPSMAMQVSNNGIVAGTFLDTRATGNGASVESSGYWQEGRWHHLGTGSEGEVTSYEDAGQANAISPNGQYIGGQIMVNGISTPVVWDNGVMKTMPNYANTNSKKDGGAILGVDNNGYAAGWTYYPSASGTINRTAALWLPDLTLPASDKVGHMGCARISPSGRYVIATDRIYDVQTQTSVTPNTGGLWAYNLCAISDDGVVVGDYNTLDQFGNVGATTGCIVIDGKFQDINTYLKEKGADLKGYLIGQVFGISGDGKTFGCMAYDLTYAGDGVRIYPIVVKLDEDLSTREPAGIDAMTLEGANAVMLDWRKPLAGAAGVKSYEIYRDGELLKTFEPNVFKYIDTNVPDGHHSYTAKAVYDGATSNSTDAAEATVTAMQPSAPNELLGIPSRVNDVRLMWDTPFSSFPSLRYYNEGDDISGLGWGTNSLECAIRLSADMLAAYGEGATIQGITFYPMSAQNEWNVNIYNASNTDTPIYTQKLKSSTLKYGQANTVMFTTPLAIPAGNDLIVAVSATVDKFGVGSMNVMGRVTGKKRIGYTDLMRRVGVDKDFFSMYELSMGRGEDDAAEDNTTWPFGALIAKAGTNANNVAKYKVFEGEENIAETSELYTTIKNVADGKHTFGVTAVYADGKESPAATVSIDVKANTEVYDITGVKATTDGLTVNLEWNAPINDDATNISYATGNTTKGGLIGSADYNYSYTVGAIYKGHMLKPYSGYKIKALRFYPLSKAYFSFSLTSGGKEVAYKEINDEDYTVGRWNTIELDEPIDLDPNAEYLLALECFEPTPGSAPIALDKYMAHTNAGDLYKQGDGAFLSLSENSDNATGNWMIGMVIGTPESEDLGVKGYNVRTGNAMTGETLLNDAPLTDCKYSYTFDKAGTYTLRVSPVYDEPVGERTGQTVTCRLTASSIDNATSGGVKVYPNPATTFIKADGNVQSLTLYSMAGAKIAHADESTLNVQNVPGGVYVLKVGMKDGNYCTKVTINR